MTFTELFRVEARSDDGRVNMIAYVYDPLALDYVPLQQPGGSSGGGGGPVSVADGADVAQGTTTDAAWTSGAGTVIALLKKIASAGGSAVSIADGADVTQGAVADTAWSGSGSGTISAILKYVGGKIEAVRALLAGTLTVGGSVSVSNFPATQPVSLATNTPDVTDRTGRLLGHVTVDAAPTTAITVASLPLPTGAATGTKQDTGNTSLASIDGKAPALGQALAAASVPVILPSATVTTLTPPAAITGFALEAGHLATLDTKTPVLGQALAAASVPVILPTATIATLTPPAAITGFALDASVNNLLKPASTLAAVTALGSITGALPAGTNVLGHVVVDSTQATALFVQRRLLNTYTAVFRLAVRPYALSNAFAAAGRKQYATIHHAATAVKTVKLKRVEVALESSSAAAIIGAELVRITTAPATGNPAITPSPTNPGNAAAEATCLALPTTAATEGALHANLEWNLGITAAGSVVNPPPGLNWYTLWPQTQGASEADENQFPTIRAGVLEGFAVTLDASVLATAKGFVVIEFTEE